MARARKMLICSLGAVAVLATFWGCNGTNVDDPSKSDSLLVIDSVSPASVQADVSPDVDPNTMVATPPADDTVDVNVRNLNRTQSASGIFGDILITSVELFCEQNSLPSTTSPVSLTVPAESSATISVLVAPGPYKQTNSASLLTLGSDVCQITFNGQDLSGEDILSTVAVVHISYVDTP